MPKKSKRPYKLQGLTIDGEWRTMASFKSKRNAHKAAYDFHGSLTQQLSMFGTRTRIVKKRKR